MKKFTIQEVRERIKEHYFNEKVKVLEFRNEMNKRGVLFTYITLSIGNGFHTREIAKLMYQNNRLYSLEGYATIYHINIYKELLEVD